MLGPKAWLLVSVRMACPPHCPAGDRETPRGQVTCPRSRRRAQPRPPDLGGCPSQIPFSRAGPLHPAARRAGARASPTLSSVSPPVWVSTRAQRGPHPQPLALRRPAPLPAANSGSACARPTPSRCAGAKARLPVDSQLSCSRAALCPQGLVSRAP